MIPLAIRKNAGIHNKIDGKSKGIDRKSKSAAIKSTALSTSPIKTNSPFRNKSPAQKIKYCGQTLMPKISIINANAEAKSIPPSIFTSTIFFLK